MLQCNTMLGIGDSTKVSVQHEDGNIIHTCLIAAGFTQYSEVACAANDLITCSFRSLVTGNSILIFLFLSAGVILSQLKTLAPSFSRMAIVSTYVYVMCFFRSAAPPIYAGV